MDVDGDGLDDVVVGAPLFVDDRGGRMNVDQGRVAVYLNDKLVREMASSLSNFFCQ